jgi:3-hydroxybenzoate 6-monooxygenase
VARAHGTPRIAVIGGGIGGLSTALAIARSGIEVVVLEASTEFVELGAGLQLAPNATRILADLGVFGDVEQVAVLPRQLVLADARSGRDLVTVDLRAPFRDRYGHPYLVMHRHDLLSILLAACEANGVELLPGHQAIGVDDQGSEVLVRCANGEVFVATGAVAADGLWSTMRDRIVGDTLIEEPYVAYRGTVPSESGSPLARTDAMVMWVGPGLHFVQYALRAGAIYNQVAVFRSNAYESGSSTWGDAAELEATFAGTCDAIQEGLKAIKRDRRWPMLHRSPARRWTEGRLTLLGDAAHPMLQYVAQGACQAMEDALVLSSALSETDADVPRAFELYERVRRPRTELVQQAARVWGDTCHVDGIGRNVRDTLLARAAGDPYPDLDWLYGYDATRPAGELLRAALPQWRDGRLVGAHGTPVPS